MPTMKKLYYTCCLLMTMGMLFSCDVLNQEPEALIATSDAIVDARSAEAALNGLYNAVQNGDLYGGRFIMANEMLAQNAIAAAFQAFWAELASGNVPASNFHLEDLWVSAYAAVNSANSLIAAVPTVPGLDAADQDRMLGTAYYFRALMFFDLLRQYGEFFEPGSPYGIPLVLNPSLAISETARATVAESFAQIAADLTEAMNRLPDSGDKFFATQGAAQALMARVALYQGNYTEALAMANAVIANGSYSLSDDYNEIYTTEGAAESIFELNFLALDDGNAWAIEMYITPPEVAVAPALPAFFAATNNAERGLLFETIDGQIRCTKYGRAREDEGSNTIISRLSEMYLIRAEALGFSGSPASALADINTIRNRAGLPNLTAIATQDDLVTALLNERRAEFAFEGHYWFDLVRLGRMEAVTGRPAFRKVMPIPQRELNITDGTIDQNPGY